MVDLEYHKGSFCIYTSVFCQEGCCSGCEFDRKMTSATQASRPDPMKQQKTTVCAVAH
jgi:hypothetical protein